MRISWATVTLLEQDKVPTTESSGAGGRSSYGSIAEQTSGIPLVQGRDQIEFLEIVGILCLSREEHTDDLGFGKTGSQEQLRRTEMRACCQDVIDNSYGLRRWLR